ncbi:hypothetical protein [Streptomyces cupreus]|uniref:Uncharacterized protein n=1 Tax=Streptomyces cupreus TaxID=2759956 RepID=A0A7X1JBA8_9ACTN|nr:hypothetical protein [Streptomyces cupreus]MBC2907619.1 hypothetical protein [Streptomyces cupreus]
MRAFLEATTGFPAHLFTAALVVVACFWLLVAVGAAEPDSFDSDADLDAWGMGGVPVAVAFSLLTVIGWALSLGATIALTTVAPAGSATGLLRLAIPVGALFVAWPTTCLIVRRLRSLFPDEPGPLETEGNDPRWGVSHDTTLPSGHQAA